MKTNPCQEKAVTVRSSKPQVLYMRFDLRPEGQYQGAKYRNTFPSCRE